ncbi:MAG: deoxyribodipyrimidine photolyase [Deltaproteobacteria bacterium HGW-Deltaproteobacteria-17]|nr:MAG: deoxyribodipyrimidine photolyase [Deltaproteobacteria bacterium HGW-Deltaproteobacteria-17]
MYWMQRSQRGWNNPALALALELANERRSGLWVLCVLDGQYPEANSRHFTFLLEGLLDVRAALQERGIPLVVRTGSFLTEVPAAAAGAGILVCDEHPEPFGRALRSAVGARVDCAALAVEGDAVLPPALLADHAHIGARTIRPAVHRLLQEFLQPLAEPDLIGPAGSPPREGVELADIGALIRRLGVPELAPARQLHGGQTAARSRLRFFIENHMEGYADNHHRADLEVSSGLSAWLHFGHLGPTEVALACMRSAAGAGGGLSSGPGLDAFLEQLIVRRELAINAACFLPGYGTPAMVPSWAQKTLDEHASPWGDVVSEAMMEACDTPDPVWNAAMTDMKVHGTMHNYLRMYWGKQVLLWSSGWREAFASLLRWNNRYFLDGRDPNGTIGVAWVFGLHDRPFGRRPVFGAVRSMTPKGLARKFDTLAYIRKVEESLPHDQAPPDRL